MLALLAAADTILEPPVAPTTGTTVSGALTGATYKVKTAYVNAAGIESAASPESSQAVATNSVLTVTSPAASGDAVSYNLYVSQPGGASGSEVLVANHNIGVNDQQPNAGYTYGTQVPPTTALPNANTSFAVANPCPHAYEVQASALFAAVSGTTGCTMIVSKVLNGTSTKLVTLTIPGVAGVAQSKSFRVDKLLHGNFDHIAVGVANLDATNVPVVAILMQPLSAT